MTIRYLTCAATAATIAVIACSNGSSPRETASATPPAPTPEASQAPTKEPATAAVPAPAEDASGSDPRGEAVTSAAAAPPLDQMSLAASVGKIGVPVDVRYQVSGTVSKNQPATVQLAFVPRVEGTNLRVEFPETPGVAVETGSGTVWSQKADVSDVFRHQVVVTPTAGDTGEMRAIVSMDLDGGRFFSVFAIPLGAHPQEAAGKRPPKG